jgi:hypothetical protein
VRWYVGATVVGVAVVVIMVVGVASLLVVTRTTAAV